MSFYLSTFKEMVHSDWIAHTEVHVYTVVPTSLEATPSLSNKHPLFLEKNIKVLRKDVYFHQGTSTLNEKLYEPVELSPILPNKSYPGPYDFCIEFEPNTDPITKATPWVYIPDRQKLFVKMQCVCPILFKIKGELYKTVSPVHDGPYNLVRYLKQRTVIKPCDMSYKLEFRKFIFPGVS